MKRDLTERPPKEFNVARIERVFTSLIQFVEFKVEGYKLSKKVAPIPADLLGLAGESELRDRWRNAFRMFDGGSASFTVNIPVRDEKGEEQKDEQGKTREMPYSESALEKERLQIERDFLYKVPGFGVVIFRSRREAFDQRVEQFKRRTKDYENALEKQIKEATGKTIDKLAEVLLPMVKQTLCLALAPWLNG